MKLKPKTAATSIALMIAVTILSAGGQIFFKKGSYFVESFISFFNIYVILGFILFAAGAAIMILALRKGELSVLQPIISLSYIWVVIAAYLLFNESASSSKIIGIIIIAAGVAFLARSK